jgi:hypothetical protein
MEMSSNILFPTLYRKSLDIAQIRNMSTREEITREFGLSRDLYFSLYLSIWRCTAFLSSHAMQTKDPVQHLSQLSETVIENDIDAPRRLGRSELSTCPWLCRLDYTPLNVKNCLVWCITLSLIQYLNMGIYCNSSHKRASVSMV